MFRLLGKSVFDISWIQPRLPTREGCGLYKLILVVDPKHEAVAVDFELGGNSAEREVGL
jgi:hypothetical protein